jgi:hypothetical protein
MHILKNCYAVVSYIMSPSRDVMLVDTEVHLHSNSTQHQATVPNTSENLLSSDTKIGQHVRVLMLDQISSKALITTFQGYAYI